MYRWTIGVETKKKLVQRGNKMCEMWEKGQNIKEVNGMR